MVFSNFPTYKQIPGRPNITVSPVGIADGYITNGGADYGPDTPGTETVGIAEAVATGSPVWVLPGTYSLTNTSPITLPNNTQIYWDNATIQVSASANVFAGVSSNGIFFDGVLTVDGRGNGYFFISTDDGSGFMDFRANITLKGFTNSSAKYAFNIYQGTNYHFGGLLYSVDSAFVLTNATNHVSISKVVAGPYTTDPATNLIHITANGSVNPVGLILGEIDIDGGGILSTTPVVVAPNPGLTLSDVTIGDVQIRNTSGNSDGFDLIQCDNVSIGRVICKGTNVGLSIVDSTNVTVAGVVASNCRAQGCAVGDGGSTGTTSHVAISSGVFQDCGTSNTGGVSCGFGTFVGSSGLTTDVRWQNCIAYNTVATMLYGYGEETGGGTISDVSVIGGRLSGNTAPYLLASGSGTTFQNVFGVNPQGFSVTTPSVPTSGTAIKNTNPFPVRIYVLTASGVTYTITDPSGTVGPSISASAGSEITLDPGASITPTYTTLTWKWYGE